MVERVEDMQLPNAIVQRIIKEALPEGINVAKDARSEIAKAASIFVLYLTSTARQAKNQKKTLTPADILQALETMEMENFIEPLKKAMEREYLNYLLILSEYHFKLTPFQSTNDSRRRKRIESNKISFQVQPTHQLLKPLVPSPMRLKLRT